jgi:hypothetical protein
MNKEYYAIENKNLAITLSYMLGEDFYTYDDTRKNREGKKLYSFRNTDRFKEIMKLVFDVKNNNK